MNLTRLIHRPRRDSQHITTHLHAAQRIQDNHPGWQVAWSTYTGRYWAYPLFDPRPDLLISAAHPRTLTARITKTERRWHARPRPATPQASPPAARHHQARQPCPRAHSQPHPPRRCPR